MTNAEKIQQMPDEELLEWLDKTGCARMPYDRWRAWLAEEADGADGSKKQGDERWLTKREETSVSGSSASGCRRLGKSRKSCARNEQ